MHMKNIFFHVFGCFVYELTKHLLLLYDSELSIRILGK